MKSVSEDSSLQNSKDGPPFLTSEKELCSANALVPHVSTVAPFLSPTVCSVLELIEPEVVFAGYDSTQPDTTDHLLTSLNHLAGKQMIRVVKWAKVLPGMLMFRLLHIQKTGTFSPDLNLFVIQGQAVDLWNVLRNYAVILIQSLTCRLHWYRRVYIIIIIISFSIIVFRIIRSVSSAHT